MWLTTLWGGPTAAWWSFMMLDMQVGGWLGGWVASWLVGCTIGGAVGCWLHG